jgi:hypothetical protein
VIFTIDEWKKINRNVYITDKITGNSYKINGKKAMFNLVKGTYTDRFVMTFSGNTLSVDENIVTEEISVYSTKNTIVIKNNNLKINKIELYNLLGQKIKNWNIKEVTSEITLTTKNLPTAIYIVKVFSEKGNLSKKIIIQE